MGQVISTERTTSLTQARADAIAEMIASTTTDSATWRLSEDWSETEHVDEQWAQSHGVTSEEAETILKGTTNSYSITTSSGGSSSSTHTDGTTTVDYNSQNYEHGNGAKLYSEVSGKYTNSTTVDAHAGLNIEGIFSLGGGVSNTTTFEIGGKAGGEYTQNQNWNEHTGTDTTTVSTDVSSSSSTWNNSNTSSYTEQASRSQSSSLVIADVLSNTYNVGRSYIHGTSQSNEQGFSSSDSQSINTSSTITTSMTETTVTTKTYTSDGKSDGWYRAVIAGKFHVYGVAGYDVASKSFFTNTFSIMDDETYEFLDYSPESSFDDNENCALQFNVPYEIYEYVMQLTMETEGLLFRTNTTDRTATVIGYTGTETDVIIPSFISTGTEADNNMTAYRVTGISASAFAGKNIRSIILGRYITEIPDNAFKNCTELEQIWGSFTSIGAEAFSGCTKLEAFTIPSYVSFVGANAFAGVPAVNANVLSEEYALYFAKEMNPNITNENQLRAKAAELTETVAAQIINCGADSISMNVSAVIPTAKLTLNVPDISAFELKGGNKTFTDLMVNSNADSTAIRNIKIKDCTRIPLVISSDSITLDTVNVTAPSFALIAKSQSVDLTIVKDNVLKSASGHAVVCKDPTIISEISTRATVGVLDITGNMYVCGNPPTPGSEYIDFVNGQIVYIGSDQFDQLVRGYFTVTFNPNGGSVDPTTKNVGFGEVYGELPVPTRSTYDFVGWFTEPSGGTQITEDTVSTSLYNQTLYAHWELKQYTVTFDANGGSCDTITMPAIIGMAPTSLPEASKDYHNFMGWLYVSPDGNQETGILVTVENYNAVIATMDPVELVTNGLTLYAYYVLKPVSNWVLYEDMPSDAQIVQQKWTYTKTTTVESTNTSMPGYTLIRSYWRQTGSGSFNYASFPDGYDTNNWYYQNWNRSAYSAYENNTNKRTVSTGWAGWIYWHWMYNVGWANVTNRAISHRYGYWNSSGGTSGGFLYQYFTAIASATDCPYLDNMYCCSQNLPSYNAISIISDTTNVGTPRMFRFNYYSCSYTDYEKVFVYQKVENLESSTPVTPSSTITNVQHWVRYRDR